MCVLSYIPHSDGRVTITHNRDEHILRPQAIPPRTYQIENEAVVFPKDPQGGGTWFALHNDWVCCLLNGGFEAHVRKPFYRTSRGMIILDFLKIRSIKDFTQYFDPQGIEPFTLVLFDLKKKKIVQLTWDEKMLQVLHLDATQAHIWSSSTLYNASIRATRTQIFKQFVATQPSVPQIKDFHKINKDNDLHESFFVNIKEKIKTVAITQVTGKWGATQMMYEPFGLPQQVGN
jgi:uncharacterized protein with NRDE domain